MQISAIKDQLSSSGYFSGSNVGVTELPDTAVRARAEYLDSMTWCKLNAPKSRMDPGSLAERPWRKLAIGSSNGVGESYAQLLQTTYFAERYTRYPALAALFQSLILQRNQVLGVADDFGSVPSRDGFWNACRIHHYPRGGSFMAAHRDTHFPKILEQAGHPFLQVMALLSTRGQDFFSGGGFIIDRQGQKIFFEDDASFGKTVFFDGSIIHGVEDVDGDQVIDFTLDSGRVAAFVNLYRVLPPG